jgi:hypothetical protein
MMQEKSEDTQHSCLFPDLCGKDYNFSTLFVIFGCVCQLTLANFTIEIT